MLHALLASCLACALGACAQNGNAQSAQGDREQSNRAETSAGTSTQTTGLPDFRPLVRQYGDAVVFVEVRQSARPTASVPVNPEDPLSDFFRRFGIPAPEGFAQPNPAPARGAGSGFIVSEDGYILTNAHVVADADSVTVRLTDRREFTAEVIGADRGTDVAVIKIDANDLPTVQIGDASALSPGQWVLAIGSPFGLENSATAGIVSATARALGGGSYVPFIQTDVAVNPGNSGGPLFNLDGEVVGINSMIFSQTGGYMGLSFAIPIDVAMDVREQLIKNGRVVRGRIGVTVQDVNAQLAESFGLDRPRGALVSSVDPEGPAADAGLKAGDVILGINDEPVERSNELAVTIAGLQPGKQAELTIWREGKQRELDVRIEEMQDTPAQRASSPRAKGADAKLGLAVRPLTEEEKARIDTEGELVVERVTSPAAESGVLPGDIIVGVNGTEIESVEQLRDAVEDGPSTVALLIERRGAQVFVPVPIG
ncbi:MAG: DegQ family serine endoprotease [Xanthomonadaceae bacterium]|nr:DegQ family serine endoprotease [Xanthomonadaceae bacterium]